MRLTTADARSTHFVLYCQCGLLLRPCQRVHAFPQDRGQTFVTAEENTHDWQWRARSCRGYVNVVYNVPRLIYVNSMTAKIYAF